VYYVVQNPESVRIINHFIKKAPVQGVEFWKIMHQDIICIPGKETERTNQQGSMIYLLFDHVSLFAQLQAVLNGMTSRHKNRNNEVEVPVSLVMVLIYLEGELVIGTNRVFQIIPDVSDVSGIIENCLVRAGKAVP
jgi:hypothetical protein